MKKYLEHYAVQLMVYPRLPHFSRHAFYYVCIFFSTWTTQFIEVFTRKDFGVRHFNLGVALRLAFIIALIPLIPLIYFLWVQSALLSQVPDGMRDQAAAQLDGAASKFTPGADYILWYVFIAAFVVMSVRHWRDQRKRPPSFEKPQHTRFAGEPHKWFYTVRFSGIKPTIKVIECWYEPGIFFFTGLFCFLIGQSIGLPLMICAALYSGYAHACYWFGMQAVMNEYDHMLEEQWNEGFLEEKSNEMEKRRQENYRDQAIDEEDYRKRLRRRLASLPAHPAKVLVP